MKAYMTWRNARILPIVILVRIPIVGTLLLLIKAGELAQDIAYAIERYLPGLRRD